MKAQVLKQTGLIETEPLHYEDVDRCVPGPGEIEIQVLACGMCLTDLHIIEADIPLRQSPTIPGHQIVGTVVNLGPGVTSLSVGMTVGVPWLHSTCKHCEFCDSQRENLCDNAKFTGYDTFGGYAEYAIAVADYVVLLEDNIDPIQIAPLLCGGIVGYRSYQLSKITPGKKLGLFGFGSSAHIIIQVATHFGVEVEVFTRTEASKELALRLGACFAGDAKEAPGRNLDAGIIFAPAGELVLDALASLKKGATLAFNAIHASDIPQMPYDLLYYEREIKSVSHATRKDAIEFIKLAGEIGIKPEVKVYNLSEANQALLDSKNSKNVGSVVLVP